MKFRSLRARLIAGVVIWTSMVLLAAFVLAAAIVVHNPRWTLVVHNSLVLLGGAALAAAGGTIIRHSLSPFEELRARLGDVREGRSRRLEGEYPSEVSPVVDDLNALLADRDLRIARAAARAGDLAHGLKTPLAVLSQDVDRAEAAGHTELAASIRQQVGRMRRQVDSHLASARAAAGTTAGMRAHLADASSGLIRTLERLHADRALSIATDVSPDLAVRVPLEDLEEMLGNLLDNACKWAAQSVSLSARRDGQRIVIRVDDDGPGLPAGMHAQVIERGIRLDEKSSGSGLGLAIVRDLAEAYGGAVELLPSPKGGVRAELTLPVAPFPSP